MNVDKFSQVCLFENVDYAKFFVTGIGKSQTFYATKGFIKSNDGLDDDVLICWAPLEDLRRNVDAPCLYYASVIDGRFVLDIDKHVRLTPSLLTDDVETSLQDCRPGNLIMLEDKVLLALYRTEQEERYYNIETGEVITNSRRLQGIIIKSWKLLTLNSEKPKVLITFPGKNLNSETANTKESL